MTWTGRAIEVVKSLYKSAVVDPSAGMVIGFGMFVIFAAAYVMGWIHSAGWEEQKSLERWQRRFRESLEGYDDGSDTFGD